MTGKNDRVVGKPEENVPNRSEQDRQVASWEIRSTDRPREERVTDKQRALRRALSAHRQADAARAVATGGLPDGLSDDEKIALRLTQQLSANHRVDESLYREAEAAFGPKGLIDIAFLIGIYHSVCATLTMFAIPAPE